MLAQAQQCCFQCLGRFGFADKDIADRTGKVLLNGNLAAQNNDMHLWKTQLECVDQPDFILNQLQIGQIPVEKQHIGLDTFGFLQQ